jgi:hypothetical protein
MTLDERLAWVRQYLGRYIETSRPTTAEERSHDGPHSSETSGGAGVLIDVLVEDGAVHACMDWGVSWIITDDTTIVARPLLDLAVCDVVKVPHRDVETAPVIVRSTMDFRGLTLPTADVLINGQLVTYLVAELERV